MEPRISIERVGRVWPVTFPLRGRSAWLAPDSEPTVDWASTVSGSLTDTLTGDRATVSLPAVVERLSRELERALHSPSFGVPELSGRAGDVAPAVAREVMSNAFGGIIAAIGMKALGG